jgi:5-methylcytosine-specific restriction endonuclease McrA
LFFAPKPVKKIGEDYLGEVDPSGKKKITKVVLTIAHLDNQTSNNDPGNLKALCQRCHLALDSDLHRNNARKTRNQKKKQIELF